MSVEDDLPAFGDELLPSDEVIWNTPYSEVLARGKDFRMRWLKLLQLSHPELERVCGDVLELMNPDNEVKIVSVVGMTGVGKTTLARELNSLLQSEYGPSSSADEIPVIYAAASSPGSDKLSWKDLYYRLLTAVGEPGIEGKSGAVVVEGYLRRIPGGGHTTWNYRHYVEKMLKHRRVRAMIVDEALHLLRNSDYANVMDTLKSLADVSAAKLVLIGTHQIADLMVEYGQVVRRSEIVHFRRYDTAKDGSVNTDLSGYTSQLQKFQDNWPCARKPNLVAIAEELRANTLGSTGFTKQFLLKLLHLQLSTPDEHLEKKFFAKAVKGKKSLQKVEDEVLEGESKLLGECYGEGHLSNEALDAVMRKA